MATSKPAGFHAFVLHSYDWSDSSLVLDLLTREQGRIAVIAKGAKRPTSQLRAVLLPMQRLHIQLTRTKGPEPVEVHTLRQAEWMASHPLPRGAALLAGYYLNELLMRLLPRAEPHAGVFEPYATAIAGLALSPDAPETWLRAFELVLLQELGWLPDLLHDSLRQQPLRPGHTYSLSPELGLVPAPDAQGLVAGSWSSLAAALPDGIPALARVVAGLADRSALKPVLRGVLHYHLGHQTLRSRQVLHQAHDLLAPPRP
jgi:DNA repair protein RecO (recombination protein O)